MLLDAPRILRYAQRIGGPEAGVFLRRTERTLTEYVKAQLLISLVIGTSAGIVLWVYGVTGIFPLGATFAVAFAAWVFLMEFVPYVGPILGAVPPVLLALFTSPLAALWVVVAFIAIHQLEGHIVVPKIMGGAVGVHPLVVIFGLLIGEQVAGIVGILIAIPVVVVVKEAVTFAGEQLGLQRAASRPGAAPVVPAAGSRTPPPCGRSPDRARSRRPRRWSPAACAATSAACAPWTASTSTSPAARRWRCWARTAPARRRSSPSWRASRAPAAEPCSGATGWRRGWGGCRSGPRCTRACRRARTCACSPRWRAPTTPARWPRACWSAPTSARWRTGRPPSCPPARSSGSTSRSRSPAARACCCWTSRPRR